MGMGIDKDATKGWPSNVTTAPSGGVFVVGNQAATTTVTASGGPASLSIWPLDTDGEGGAAFAYYDTGSADTTTGHSDTTDQTAPVYLLGRGNGELTTSTDWTLYYKDFPATASICYDFVQMLHFSGAIEGRDSGDSFGEVNRSAKVPQYQTNTLIGVNPWFNSYEDYAADIRVLAQGHSLLPEFKMSDHMQYHLDSGGFTGKNNAYLEIEGASTTVTASATSEANPINTQFFRDFTETSPMTHLKKFQDEHAAADPVMEPNTFTVSFDGIMKLLPYQGFYPALRTVQLATMFSQSYGPYIGAGTAKPGGDDMDNWPAKPDGLRNQATRTAALMQPFFAPGILYNTIKSGVAVDWATYKGDQIGSTWWWLRRAEF